MMFLLVLAIVAAASRLGFDARQLSGVATEETRQMLRDKWLPLVSPHGEWFSKLRQHPRPVIDVFLYNDEIDTLEIRLATLSAVVDYHLLIESNTTFTGHAKPLHYASHHSSQFSTACQQRVRHYAVPPITTSNAWDREYRARRAYDEAVAMLLSSEELGDDDYNVVVLEHDLDEIPSPEIIWLMKWCVDLPPLPLQPKLRFYYYAYSWRRIILPSKGVRAQSTHDVNIPAAMWDGTIISTLATARPRWRVNGKLSVQSRITDGGWHCSSCLRVANLATKLRSFSHTEIIQGHEERLSEAWLLHIKRMGLDFAMRNDVFFTAVNPLDEAPPFVLANADAFAYMLFPPSHDGIDGTPREAHSRHPRLRKCT
jgi:beta-1,4-mannosyl-glycoprotein beta-1,4-N-acetylglucosaminyltransferase